MPTTAGEDMAPTVMERGLLMLRLPLTMAAGAMAATDMASVQLMPMPTTGEAMAIDMASVQLMLRLPLTMAAGAMAAMDMASALLMLMPTTAGEAMAATDMASALLMPTTEAGAMAATATESRFLQSTAISNCLDLNLHWKAKFYSFPPENCVVIVRNKFKITLSKAN